MGNTQETAQWEGFAPSVRVERLGVTVLEGPHAGRLVLADSDVITIGSASNNDLVLDEPTVSRFHVELRAREDGVHLVDHGSTNGTYVHGVRLERAVLSAGTELTLGRVKIAVCDADATDVETVQADRLGDLRGRSDAMRRLMAAVRRAAKSEVAVLLGGESGTGKELVARALHEEGPRASGPFVVVDCASLSPTLIGSELFGHEKGAFTGADRRHEGAFERARGGTIFLDEIGELPDTLQPVLLGVLERRRLRRLGGRDEIPVDVRVVSATHRELRAAVNQGRFRLDLFYRIAVVSLAVPPLREHLEDVPMLFEHFAREAGFDGPIETILTASRLGSLLRHDWPGNVRELRNWVEATLAMGEMPELARMNVSTTASEGVATSSTALEIGGMLGMPYRDARAALLQDFELRYVKCLLEKTKGNVAAAAREASMDRSYLFDLIRRHGLR